MNPIVSALQPFIWGRGGKQLTPDQVARERLRADALASAIGDTSPVGHWTAGAARLVDAFNSVRRDKRADTQEAAGMASADEAIRGNPVLASLLGGDQAGMATPSPVVNALAQQPGGAGTIQSAPTTSAPGVAGAFSGSSLAQGVLETAQAIGADPLDLATVISYETGGTFDPLKAGPTTQWGQHRGLIQFGEPQAQQYGVDFSTPEAALATQLGADGAIANYFRSSGYQPGMSGIDLYSTVNAGAPGRYSASDANNGGAPGDVSDKWNNQMAGHREKAAALLGGTYTPPTMSGGGASGGSPNNIVAILAQAQGNPWVAKKYGPVIEALMGQQMRRDDASFEQQMRQSDPMYQAQLQQAQLQLEQMRNPAAPKPIEVGGVLLDPVTYQPIFDSRQGVGDGHLPAEVQSLQWRAEQAGLVPGTSDYQDFMRNAGRNSPGVPAGFAALDAQAKAAGLVPDTDDYRQFMLGAGAGERARASTVGKAQGEAELGLSAAAQKAELAIANLEAIRNDPALPSITGMIQGRLPPTSQAGTDLNTRIQQAQGQAFLEAFASLKGGGAITEIEGTKAEQAMARLNRAQSTEAYQAALDELSGILRQGVRRAYERAGRPVPAAEQPAPTTGAGDLLKKYGLQ